MMNELLPISCISALYIDTLYLFHLLLWQSEEIAFHLSGRVSSWLFLPTPPFFSYTQNQASLATVGYLCTALPKLGLPLSAMIAFDSIKCNTQKQN